MSNNKEQNIFQELFSEIEIPDRLSPENIAKMLDEKFGNQTKTAATPSETIGIISDDDYENAVINTENDDAQEIEALQKREKIGIKTTPTAVIARITITVAACLVLVVGLILFNNNNMSLKTAGAAGAKNYDEVYSAVMQAGSAGALSQNINTDYIGYNVDKNAVNKPNNTAVAVNDKLWFISGDKLFIDAGGNNENVVVSGGEYKEIIADDKNVYVISEEKSTLLATATINGEENTADVTEYVTRVDIYSSANDCKSFTQSGRFIKAVSANEGIMLTTAFSDESPYPLKNSGEKDRYIPKISIDDEEKFLEASEIILSDNAQDKSYGIVTYLSRDDALSYNTLAILGHSRNLYTDENTVAFANNDSKSIIAVKLSQAGGLAYSAVLADSKAISVTENDDNKLVVLTDDLRLYYEAQSSNVKLNTTADATNIISYNGKLYITDENKAYEVTSDTLTEVSSSVFLQKISDDFYISFSKNPFEAAVSDSEAVKSVVTHNYEDVKSSIFDNPSALLTDGMYAYYPFEYWNGIEYVYAYAKLDNSGKIISILSLSDTDLSGRFTDGFIAGNKLYAVSAKGVTIADTSSMTASQRFIVS